MVQDSHILVGHIQGVFGIKGWLKIFSHCRPKEQILDYLSWELRAPKGADTYELQDGKPHGGGIIVKLKHIDDRTHAETLKGAEIWVAKSSLSDLSDDEYYWFELEGLQVNNLQGELLGQVVKLMETGANDVLVVKDVNAKQEILVPFIKEQVIKQVDIRNKTITVDWLKEYSV
ncbi:MAG: ribosome maturation factor RimM [Pseudomonadota bacterium]